MKIRDPKRKCCACGHEGHGNEPGVCGNLTVDVGSACQCVSDPPDVDLAQACNTLGTRNTELLGWLLENAPVGLRAHWAPRALQLTKPDRPLPFEELASMSNERDPNRDQPLPVKGKVAVQPYLMKILLERAEHGREKYGTYLETNNGRDPLVDLFEELLDALTYLTQVLIEKGYKFPGVLIPEGHPAYNKTQDLIEGDGPTQDAAKAWLDAHQLRYATGCSCNCLQHQPDCRFHIIPF